MAKAFNGEMFQRVPINPPGRNVFDLSHENKFTTEFGRLTPIFCEEVLPGDKWNVSASTFIRMMPMVAPVMHEINSYIHFFFVPRRLLWKNWQDFITGVDSGGGIDGQKGSEHMPHYIDGSIMNSMADYGDLAEVMKLFSPSSLWDYLGYPTIDQNAKIWIDYAVNESDSSRMEIDPLIAYQFIWNEYYRDQNIEYDEFDLSFWRDSDGVNSLADWLITDPNYANWNGRNIFKLKYRAWEKDYFTSALPEPQRGPDVSIPIDINADVNFNYYAGDTKLKTDNPEWFNSSESSPLTMTQINGSGDGKLNFEETQYLSYKTIGIDNSDQLSVQISGINSTINDLRMALRLQEFYELSARVGNRYKEMIVGHFGVFTPDYRIDRPQYLGGSKFPLQISQVLQTSATQSTEQPLGDMAGHGISGSSNFMFNEEFYEHGYIIGIMSILPRSSYHQGLHRKFTRFDRLDHYWEKFSHLGEQEVKNKELYFDYMSNGVNVPGEPNRNDGTFGYQSRYSEYKYIANHLHGDFKTTLNYWHLGRRFSRLPQYGNEFITCSADSILYGSDPSFNQEHNLNRIFAYQGTDFDHFLCQVHFDVKAVRPMPIFGVPRL